MGVRCTAWRDRRCGGQKCIRVGGCDDHSSQRLYSRCHCSTYPLRRPELSSSPCSPPLLLYPSFQRNRSYFIFNATQWMTFKDSLTFTPSEYLDLTARTALDDDPLRVSVLRVQARVPILKREHLFATYWVWTAQRQGCVYNTAVLKNTRRAHPRAAGSGSHRGPPFLSPTVGAVCGR